MRPALFIVPALLAAQLISGCAVKPLKAPCSADEGEATPLSYAQTSAKGPNPLLALDHCGPMKPVN